MLTMPPEEIGARAEIAAAAIARVAGWSAQLVDGVSAIGGGSAPGVELATRLIAIAKDGLTPDALEARLRELTPPVIGRIERDRLLLDLRTVLPDQDAALVQLIQAL
jgi:L-seryl-tRNA(Ser) seleniumtransferase